MYELIIAQKKAHEAALMAELPGIKVKAKYEYDSDEETDEYGTWEHKNRHGEMDATKRKCYFLSFLVLVFCCIS